MLYLLLRMGTERYALDARRIVEVVPMVELKPLPHTQPYVAGLFDYRGTLVPVIDLCRLTTAHHCGAFLTTRIVLVDYPGRDNQNHILGLLAEQVTETVKIKDAEFQSPGIHTPEAPYLDDLVKVGTNMVQRLDITKILPGELQENLFLECA